MYRSISVKNYSKRYGWSRLKAQVQDTVNCSKLYMDSFFLNVTENFRSQNKKVGVQKKLWSRFSHPDRSEAWSLEPWRNGNLNSENMKRQGKWFSFAIELDLQQCIQELQKLRRSLHETKLWKSSKPKCLCTNHQLKNNFRSKIIQEFIVHYHVRASPKVLGTWPCTFWFDEEKSTYAGLAQENGFSPAYLLSFLRLVTTAQKAVHLLERSIINMIWLLHHVFDWLIIMIGWGGLLLVFPTYLQSLFQSYG